ncbi:hypothetical protein LC653_29180 [Nostoc sp. CHAB 5784]|uniref:hypothetical protein n=1 Tax=Nostoc mirabile TaxID=2907820 RepID=UPI001E2E3493|nr:hypothetical protein [Nostoc mirabile]MCC5667842.1 hypothetical protein [Nostoc mirabile CHAB5784]
MITKQFTSFWFICFKPNPQAKFVPTRENGAPGIPQDLLSWYNKQGDRYLTPEEKAEKSAWYLRSLTIDPDNLPSE